MEEKPNYYSVIPAIVRYDNELKPNEKLLYGEITSLTNKNNECWATNSYFARLYNVNSATISRWISHLKEKGDVVVEFIYKNETKEIEKRVPLCRDEITLCVIVSHKGTSCSRHLLQR